VFRSFEVDNFRGLTSLVLDDLSKVNLLTGFNDAGKTSVLEALYLLSSGPLAGITTIQTLRPSRRQDAIQMGQFGENAWASLFRNFDMSTPVRLLGKSPTGAYALELREDSSGRGHTLTTQDGSGANRIDDPNSLSIVEKRGNGRPTTYVQSMKVEAIAGPGNSQNVSVDFRLEPPANQSYAPAVLLKGLAGIDLAAAYSESRRKPNGLDLLAALHEIDDRIEHLEVLVTGGRPLLHADLGGKLIPFELLGDGPVAMAQYLLAMSSLKNGVLLIDEVGAGLHYSVLPKMWKALYRAAKRVDVQIFATTHSQESVLAAQSVIADHSHDLSVYRLARAGANEPTRVTQYSSDKLAAAVDLNAELR
jgi:hypothetical protein